MFIKINTWELSPDATEMIAALSEVNKCSDTKTVMMILEISANIKLKRQLEEAYPPYAIYMKENADPEKLKAALKAFEEEPGHIEKFDADKPGTWPGRRDPSPRFKIGDTVTNGFFKIKIVKIPGGNPTTYAGHRIGRTGSKNYLTSFEDCKSWHILDGAEDNTSPEDLERKLYEEF